MTLEQKIKELRIKYEDNINNKLNSLINPNPPPPSRTIPPRNNTPYQSNTPYQASGGSISNYSQTKTSGNKFVKGIGISILIMLGLFGSCAYMAENCGSPETRGMQNCLKEYKAGKMSPIEYNRCIDRAVGR